MSDYTHGSEELTKGQTKYYTPTTEEVRGVYRGSLIQTDTNIYALIDEVQADAEFDRWLAEVKTKAVTEWQIKRITAFRKALTDSETE